MYNQENNFVSLIAEIRNLEIVFRVWLKQSVIIGATYFPAESQQSLNVDKDTTLPVSAKKAKALELKVRRFYLSANLSAISLKTALYSIRMG